MISARIGDREEIRRRWVGMATEPVTMRIVSTTEFWSGARRREVLVGLGWEGMVGVVWRGREEGGGAGDCGGGGGGGAVEGEDGLEIGNRAVASSLWWFANVSSGCNPPR